MIRMQLFKKARGEAALASWKARVDNAYGAVPAVSIRKTKYEAYPGKTIDRITVECESSDSSYTLVNDHGEYTVYLQTTIKEVA